MKIASLSRQDSAVGFYRVHQPTQFIDKVSKEKSRITPFTGKGRVTRISSSDPNIEAWDDKTLMGICKDADILWSTVIYDRDEMVKMLDIRRWANAKWVVDIDDDLYSIPVDNPNKKSTEALRSEAELCLSLADGVTVSTPRLKEVYKRINPHIYVNPNGQDIDFWKKLTRSYNTLNRKPRIIWRGATGHGADTSLIEPALKELAKTYSFELVTLGAKPPFKTEHHEWVGCLEYPEALKNLNADIALVPLIDSPYNQAKSNVAVQEFSMLKIPVVASPVENQLNMPISYAKTNFSWYNEIEKFLKDRKLRQKQGLEQYNFVKKHYDVAKLSPELMSWFKNLPRKEI